MVHSTGANNTTLRRYVQPVANTPDRETLLADSQYRFVERVVRSSVRRKDREGVPTVTERIDAVATQQDLGPSPCSWV